MKQTTTIACPVCGELIEIIGGYQEKQLECSQCGELFRIVSLEPLQLAYAYDLDEEGEFCDQEGPGS